MGRRRIDPGNFPWYFCDCVKKLWSAVLLQSRDLTFSVRAVRLQDARAPVNTAGLCELYERFRAVYSGIQGRCVQLQMQHNYGLLYKPAVQNPSLLPFLVRLLKMLRSVSKFLIRPWIKQQMKHFKINWSISGVMSLIRPVCVSGTYFSQKLREGIYVLLKFMKAISRTIWSRLTIWFKFV